jgi:hypothetical protein
MRRRNKAVASPCFTGIAALPAQNCGLAPARGRGKILSETVQREIVVYHASKRAARPALAAMTATALTMLASAAYAQQYYPDQLTPTPDIETVGQRYILMVLDQPDRDLSQGRTKVNVMVDTRTGKTWVLQYARKPSSNELGYVWSEIPFARAPGDKAQ